jgi:hypothetical protein
MIKIYQFANAYVQNVQFHTNTHSAQYIYHCYRVSEKVPRAALGSA